MSPRARWAVAWNGRIAHLWEWDGCYQNGNRAGDGRATRCKTVFAQWAHYLKPAGKAKRCARCEKAKP